MLTEIDVFFRSMLQSCGTLVLNPCLFLRRTELNRIYSKPCVKRSLFKRQIIGFQDQLLLNAGQKYSRMLQGEHYAILSCADPGIFVRGFQVSLTKNSSYNPFFWSSTCFREVKGSISKKSIIFKVPEGIQHFPGGGGSNFFRGGPIVPL